MNKCRTHQSEIIIFSFFILLSLVVTYPLILKISFHIYGVLGDSSAAIWRIWWNKYALLNGISSSFCPLIAVPFGVDFSKMPCSPLIDYLTLLLALPFNEIFAYNFYILVSFPLSAITMYYLVRHFTKDKSASAVAGIIYGFCPYHFAHAWQHITLSDIQWMPLYVLTLFKLDEARTYKRAILCGLAFSLVTLSNHYCGYFMVVFTVVFILWKGWQGWQAIKGKNKEQVSRWESEQVSKKHRAEAIQQSSSQAIKTDRRTDGETGRRGDRSPITDHQSPFKTGGVVLIAIIIAISVILPFNYSALRTFVIISKTTSVSELGYVRPLEDLFMYSARPLGYLLPSIDHPILGRYTEKTVETPFYGGHPIEQTLYLGWVGVILSFVAIRQWRRKNREQVRKWESGQVSREQRLSGYQVIRLSGKGKNRSLITDYRSRRAVSFFLFAGIVALLFSFEPYLELGNFRIFFPSYFMYKIIPMVRIIARFGIVVLLSVSVLAGIGLTSVLRRMSTPMKKGIFTSLIILLIFFEFTNIPPFHTTDVSTTPPVYKWLSEQPGDFIIAEYPLETDSRYLFYQRIHQKRLINGALPGSQADRIHKRVINILDPETPGILRHLGAKYVIFHPEEYLKSEGIEIIGELPDFSQQKGLKLVRTFDDAQVYAITAEPISVF